MSNNVLDVRKLEQVLQSRWADYLDAVQLMRVVIEHVRDTPFRVLKQAEMPKKQTRLTATRVIFKDDWFEMWLEFAVPKNEGVVIGTAICGFTLTGEFWITESYGTEFQSETGLSDPSDK